MSSGTIVFIGYVTMCNFFLMLQISVGKMTFQVFFARTESHFCGMVGQKFDVFNGLFIGLFMQI